MATTLQSYHLWMDAKMDEWKLSACSHTCLLQKALDPEGRVVFRVRSKGLQEVSMDSLEPHLDPETFKKLNKFPRPKHMPNIRLKMVSTQAPK